MSSAALRHAALQLPSRERAELAADLLSSLDDLSEADLSAEVEWDAAWEDELEHRATQADAETAAMVPSSAVFEDARRRRAARE